jgi:cell division septation protein DedD
MAKRRQQRKKQAPEYPGWMWMLFGLAIGLSVAFAIYEKGVASVPQARPVAREAMGMAAPLVQETLAGEPASEDQPESRFTFYEDLPTFEIIIPEEEPDVSQDSTIETVEKPGVYVLQAGSFGAIADADRRRVQLAFLGIESRIQRVAIDDKIYHRVRIGPIDELDKLNLIRDQLRNEKIDVLRIRLGD